jgi:transposase
LPRHRGTEFLKFLRRLEQEVPQDVELHLILDNYRTHKSAAVQRSRRWITPSRSAWPGPIHSGRSSEPAVRRPA